MCDDYDVIARFNGGPNAGHTISYNNQALRLHQVPSGVRNPHSLNVIGNGALVDLSRLSDEVDAIQEAGLEVSKRNLALSYASHLILPHHVALDELREQGSSAQGSTRRGIAFVAGEKYQRTGVQADIASDPVALRAHATERLKKANEQLEAAGIEPHDVIEEIGKLMLSAERFAPYLTDTFALMHRSLRENKQILAEGAQAASLDIEQAPYPFGSSSHTTVGGVLTGLSIGPRKIGRIVGVMKGTKSHVGDGPFPTEILDPELAARVRGERGKIDSEYGASTGRPRRIGYLDLPELRRAVMVNDVTTLALTKLDCIPKYGDEVQIATAYELDGDLLTEAPNTVRLLNRCKPVYETFATWEQDISGCRQFDALPAPAQHLVEFLERQLETPIGVLGVGPHHDQVILR